MAPPNIILITVQGQRWDSFGFADDPTARTPNIDAIAAQGLVFDRASTIALEPDIVQHGLLTGMFPSIAREPAPITNDLRSAGYVCAGVGDIAVRFQSGFDTLRSSGPGRGIDDASGYARFLYDSGVAPTISTDQRDIVAQRSPIAAGSHIISWIGMQAIRCVQQVTSPFFLHISFPRPSPPYDPPIPWDAHTPEPENGSAKQRRAQRHYAGLIAFIDHQIGRLVATLSARGITRNVLVYTAHHGDNMGVDDIYGVCEAKLSDSMLRVPLIVGGVPGQRRRAVESSCISSIDIAPALLEVAGLKSSANGGGLSFMPLLLKPGKALRDGVLARMANGKFAWRDETGLLVCDEAGAPEFYREHSVREGRSLDVGASGMPPPVAIRLRRIDAERKRLGLD